MDRALPADALRAVLSLLRAEELATVSRCSSLLRAAALDDSLWAPHYSQQPRWRRCGQPLPAQPGSIWPTYHALHAAARSRCLRCTIDPSKRPWTIGWEALDRARTRANEALQALVPELLAAGAGDSVLGSASSLTAAVWLTGHRHDGSAGVGGRCWLSVCEEGRKLREELGRSAALPHTAGQLPPGWSALGSTHCPTPTPPDKAGAPGSAAPLLALEAHEWANLERWAKGLRGGDGAPEPPLERTGGPLSSQLALRTRAAALAFAETLVAAQCVLCYRLERDANGGLRRVGLGVVHLASGSVCVEAA